MNEIKEICQKCGAVNTIEDFACIHNVKHEIYTKCGNILEMSLVRFLKIDD